jgi:hypothetical protein
VCSSDLIRDLTKKIGRDGMDRWVTGAVARCRDPAPHSP